MNLKVYSVFDSKAEAYLPPFFVPKRAQAIRMFTSAAQDASHVFCKHAADYTLFEIGDFDDSTGAYVPLKAHVNLGCALVFAGPVVDQRQLAINEFMAKQDPDTVLEHVEHAGNGGVK